MKPSHHQLVHTKFKSGHTLFTQKNILILLRVGHSDPCVYTGL